jgi:ribulose-phosphate 3-epimerase
MISNLDLIPEFAKAGADIITIHAEATPHVDRALAQIKSLGKKAGVSICPSTHESTLTYAMDVADLILVMTVNPGFGGQSFIRSQLPKIRAIREMIETSGRDILLEVDGGINPATARDVVAAGANVLVAGSAVFTGNAGDYAKNIEALRA